VSKVDIGKVVASVHKLYNKDKKSIDLITTGAAVKLDYTEVDVIPLAESNPIRQLYGILGLPYNKIVQFAGKPDSGKSTVAAETIVAAQKSGAQTIVWDSEDKLDTGRIANMGGKPENILLAKTNEILKGGELVRKYIIAIKDQDPNAKILVVWDSAGGSQSRSHAERELDNERHAQPGQDAKEIGTVMKMIVALINKYPDSIAVYIANQTYAKIGFMMKGDAASGGSKLEFHSSGIVFLKRIKVLTKKVKGAEVKYGIITRATVYKNHLSRGKTSIHKMDFTVTADGYSALETMDETEDDN
jgi:RecA/RadA recombinase